VHGFRNAQATVLAPTGTISFMMDCDTTGVEPDFSLVKSKKLVGGGEITIVNKTVPMALSELGYAPREVEEIVAYIDERAASWGSAPQDRALPGVRLRDRRARDPLHGSREDDGRGAAVHLGRDLEDGQPARADVGRRGLAAADRVVAARRQGDRDLPRQLQGRAAALRVEGHLGGGRIAQIHALGGVVASPEAAAGLPDDRTEVGRKFKVGEYEGYIHVGLFEDGTPGDIFVDIAKEGTTLAGLMNSFMISVSLGLQYGVPLDVYVSKFSHMRFEPSGMTNDADIRVAKSIVDYIFRWMGKKFLSPEQQEEAGILTPEVKARLAAAYTENPGAGAAAAAVESGPPGQTALFNQWEDAVECARCGGRMVRTGSCYTCRDCGTNTGCSCLRGSLDLD
jgi:ribonucleoside-diphosphate reductase alpha chain